VQLTLEPGASVSEVGRTHGVNANQLFKWRRQHERGQLSKGKEPSTALLPVTISADEGATPEIGADVQSPRGGAIHIELPGKVMISVESGADRALLHCVLASLRK
jgi:transposase